MLSLSSSWIVTNNAFTVMGNSTAINDLTVSFDCPIFLLFSSPYDKCDFNETASLYPSLCCLIGVCRSLVCCRPLCTVQQGNNFVIRGLLEVSIPQPYRTEVARQLHAYEVLHLSGEGLGGLCRTHRDR